MALSSCAKQVTWLRRLMWEVGTRSPFGDNATMALTMIFSDSTAAMAFAQNEQVTARNKHIDIKVHHVNDLLKTNFIDLQYVSSSANVADLLTKPVAFRKLDNLASLLHLKNFDM